MAARTAIIIPILVGIIGLATLNPRYHAYHAVDLIQLLGVGICFGVALTMAFGLRRARVSR